MPGWVGTQLHVKVKKKIANVWLNVIFFVLWILSVAIGFWNGSGIKCKNHLVPKIELNYLFPHWVNNGNDWWVAAK